jgi:hypothetical protein
MQEARARLARRTVTTAAVGAVLVLGTGAPALASGGDDGLGAVLDDVAGRAPGASGAEPREGPVRDLVRGVGDATRDLGETVRDGAGTSGGAPSPPQAPDLTETGGGVADTLTGEDAGGDHDSADGGDTGHGGAPEPGEAADPLAALPDLPRLCDTLQEAASSLPPDLRADPAVLFRAVPRELTAPLPPSLRDTVLARCDVEAGPPGPAPEPDDRTTPSAAGDPAGDATSPAVPASTGEAAALPHTGAPGLWLPALGGLLTLAGARLARVRRG